MNFDLAMFCVFCALIAIYLHAIFSSTSSSNADDDDDDDELSHNGYRSDDDDHDDDDDDAELSHNSYRSDDDVDDELSHNGYRSVPQNDNAWRKNLNKLVAGSFEMDYSLVRYLGSGSYGEVYTARKKEGRSGLFVVKFVPKRYANTDEIAILRKVKGHLNIARIIGVRCNDNYIQILMTFEGDVPFDEYLQKSHDLTEDKLRFFFHQMTAGIEFLHSNDIVHLDIKPDNMVLNNALKLAIIDFGMSKDLSIVGNGPFIGAFCTDKYRAPEMMRDTGNCICYPREADIWALGVTLFVSFFGVFPDQISKDPYVSSSSLPYSTIRRHCTAELKYLLGKMMNVVRHARLSIHEVTHHAWSKGVTLLADMTEMEMFGNHDALGTQPFIEGIDPESTQAVSLNSKMGMKAQLTEEDLASVSNKLVENAQVTEKDLASVSNKLVENAQGTEKDLVSVSNKLVENAQVTEKDLVSVSNKLVENAQGTEKDLVSVSNKLVENAQGTEKNLTSVSNKLVENAQVTEKDLVSVSNKLVENAQGTELAKTSVVEIEITKISPSCELNSHNIEDTNIHLGNDVSVPSPSQLITSIELLQLTQTDQRSRKTKSIKKKTENGPSDIFRAREAVRIINSNRSAQIIPSIESTQTKSSDSQAQMIPSTESSQTKSSDTQAQRIPSIELTQTKSSNTQAQRIPSIESSQTKSSDTQAEIILSIESSQAKSSNTQAEMILSIELSQAKSSNTQAEMIPSIESSQTKSSNTQAQMIPSIELTQTKSSDTQAQRIPSIESSQTKSSDTQAQMVPSIESSQTDLPIKLSAMNTSIDLTKIVATNQTECDESENSEIILKGARIFIQGALTLYHGYWPF